MKTLRLAGKGGVEQSHQDVSDRVGVLKRQRPSQNQSRKTLSRAAKVGRALIHPVVNASNRLAHLLKSPNKLNPLNHLNNQSDRPFLRITPFHPTQGLPLTQLISYLMNWTHPEQAIALMHCVKSLISKGFKRSLMINLLKKETKIKRCLIRLSNH